MSSGATACPTRRLLRRDSLLQCGWQRLEECGLTFRAHVWRSCEGRASGGAGRLAAAGRQGEAAAGRQGRWRRGGGEAAAGPGSRGAAGSPVVWLS